MSEKKIYLPQKHSTGGMVMRANGDIGGKTGALLKGRVLENWMPGIRSTL